MGPRLLLASTLFLATASGAAGQTTTPATPPPFTWQVRNTTRVESWSFFEPNPGGGDPDYTFIANRLLAGAGYRRRWLELDAALQYVQFGGLPDDASGPGALGTGALYFDHAGVTDSHQVYLRSAQVRLKNLAPGLEIQVGRFGYASGSESPSGNAKIESVKRMRLDSRLIGEFEWSLYQRGYDGVRVDMGRPQWRTTAALFRPTQGGFEEQAGHPLDDVGVAAVTFTLRPGTVLRHTDWQGFVYQYNDRRHVTARPDNSQRPATAVDIAMTTIGTSLVGVYPLGGGQLDTLGWFVWQTGDWYEQDHGAGAAAIEAGYQWTARPWRPWLRGGWFRSTGDADPADEDHGTFFQMLPTARKYSLSTVYNLMNSTDVFGQIHLRPRADLGLRMDVHWLRLTESADLWYSGSGATQRAGSIFGYSGRRSNGSTGLGTIVEGSADWTVSRHFSTNAYLGWMTGGNVVRGTFAGDSLVFGYVETIVSF